MADAPIHGRLSNIEQAGIDDAAIRKGQTYAAAIYDLKDHHLTALLESREAKGLKECLKKHQKIKLATGNRASAYASAINVILLDCVRAADRFHLTDDSAILSQPEGRRDGPSALLYKKNSKRAKTGFPAVLFIIVNPVPMRKLRRQI